MLRSVDEIPTGDSAFSAENTAYIERAFIGSPSKVIIYTMDKTAESYDEATKYFATQKVNYIVGAPDLTTEEATKLATWVKGIRKNSVRRPVAVLPKTAGDSRGVINFEVVNSSATDKIEVGEKQYTEAEYCSRIAGLLAGLDLRVSATYKPLTEVTAIPLVDSDEEVDTAIDAGKLTLYNDGERVVIARGVNSLTTVTEVETADLQKSRSMLYRIRLREIFTALLTRATSVTTVTLMITSAYSLQLSRATLEGWRLQRAVRAGLRQTALLWRSM